MKFINMSCPNCGATLQVNPELKQAQCNYCGNLFYMDDGVQHIQYDNAEGAGYMFEKGRQRAQAEYNTQQLYQSSTINFQQPVQPKKNMTWLWVLGWIFLFPVPLTILMLRNKELEAKVRYIIIAVAWVVYFIMAIIGHFRNPSGTADGTRTGSSRSTIIALYMGNDSDLKINVGETDHDGYVIVSSSSVNGITEEDVIFVSEDPSIVEVKSFGIDAMSRVYYEVKGIAPGETYIYAKSKDGNVPSSKRKVIVK